MLSADRGGLLARDVAQGPGDLGFATTGAKRRTRTLEEPSWALLSQKERAIHRITLSLCENKKARDGTRTRGLDLGKVALHQLSHSRIFLSLPQ